MNLRQHETSTAESATTKRGPAWYHEPESIASVQPALQTVVAPAAQPQAQQALFEPSEAERILARAGALQEVHQRMLSREQIEAVAAEIGIRPEFVQRAIEQERALGSAQALLAAHPETSATEGSVIAEAPLTALERVFNVIASTGAVVAYGIVSTLFLLMHHGPYPEYATCVWLLFVLPTLLAVSLGVTARSRRWGAGAGAALGAVVFAAAAVSFDADLESLRLDAWTVRAILILVGSGAFLGATGAQGRRTLSKLQVSSRSRRTVNRTL